MDRISIILKKENGPRASFAPALGLNTIIFKHVYWYMQQISGERLQDQWSSCFRYSFTSLSRLFQPILDSKSVGGAKTGEIREKKHVAHLQGKLGLSHTLPEQGSTIKIVEKKAESMTWLYSFHSPA